MKAKNRFKKMISKMFPKLGWTDTGYNYQQCESGPSTQRLRSDISSRSDVSKAVGD